MENPKGKSKLCRSIRHCQPIALAMRLGRVSAGCRVLGFWGFECRRRHGYLSVCDCCVLSDQSPVMAGVVFLIDCGRGPLQGGGLQI